MAAPTENFIRELEENNLLISCRTFVRLQGVVAYAMCLLLQRRRRAKGQAGWVIFWKFP